ncbi:MAG: transporter substrate-binding domain-containing protein [Kangiellaceae bacterium]|nr:transporter substrate-binding domain-containing protein [Kangiellaceae bacterium]
MRFIQFYAVAVLLILVGGNAFAQSYLMENSQYSVAVENTNTCSLTFGWAEWHPLQYIDENKVLAGFQIDLVKALAKELDCDIRFIGDDWNKLIAAVNAGKIDFIADATPTEERSQYAYFSMPYRKDTFAIYVHQNDLEKYANSDLADLKNLGFKLALNRSFLYGDEIEDWQKDKKLSHLISYSDNSRQNFKRLLKGEIDGFIEDPYVMAYKFRRKQIDSAMSTLAIPISAHPASFMFSKKKVNLEFVERFNQALKTVKKKQQFQINWLKL